MNSPELGTPAASLVTAAALRQRIDWSVVTIDSRQDGGLVKLIDINPLNQSVGPVCFLHIRARKSVSHATTMGTIRAPTPLPPHFPGATIFLAGTMGPWRSTFIDAAAAKSATSFPVTILDPTRTDWDATWREDESDPRWVTQVEWELEAMDRADILAVYLSGESGRPEAGIIGMLELGLGVGGKGKDRVVVCCVDGFGKEGNVRMVGRKYGIEVRGDVDSFVEAVMRKLDKHVRHH